MERQQEVEILIHIGAPSRAADDARYRSLANSYINFQPTNRVEFLTQTSSDPSSSDGRRELDGPEVQQGSIQDIFAISQSSELLGTLKSPQASFRSVIDNAGSPRVLMRHTPEVEAASSVQDVTMPSTQSLWQTPSSVVQDSYLGIPANVSNLTSPTRILEHYLQCFDSPLASLGITSQLSNNSVSNGNSSHSPTHPSPEDRLAGLFTLSTPLVVPCTPQYRPPSNSDESSRKKVAIEQHQMQTPNQPQIPQTQYEISSDNVIEETILATSSAPSSGARAESEPPPAKRHQTTSVNTSPRALLRATSDIGPRALSNQRSVLTVTFLSDHGYTYESLELRAPDPPISTTQVESENVITPGLERLAQDLHIPKRYRPKEEKRDLRPLERGYWLVDCSTWDPQLKRDAWAYLANYIGTGVAGWGIWCRRDSDFQWLRVYCWGAVTAHIYLLLYLASQRQILYTSSSWVDGEGITIIVMDRRD
ncbi:hypothetical protein F4677DRAFT_17328 [Hypoxylon crocopeplum]|nr:hypothetical protein F4677DRAFT_17328 [Hypoxylon crocopeplum]